ncbi:hypothetical protein pb186bvf_000372 [Paramecium bursaria]
MEQEQLLNQALQSLANGDYLKTIEILDGVTDEVLKAEVIIFKSRAYFLLKRYQECIDLLQNNLGQIMDLNANLQLVYLEELCFSFLMTEQYDQLKEFTNQVINQSDIARVQAQAYFYQGYLNCELEQYEEAYESYLGYMQNEDEQSIQYSNIAFAAMKVGDLLKAREYIDLATIVHKDRFYELVLKSDIYRQSGENEIAVKLIHQAYLQYVGGAIDQELLLSKGENKYVLSMIEGKEAQIQNEYELLNQ